MIDTRRDDRADIGFGKWKLNGGIGTLAYIFRFGKTRVGLRAVKKVLDKNGSVEILIIVPNEVILQQWLETNNMYDDLQIDTNLFKIMTIHSVLNNILTEQFLTIYDEPHLYLSEERYGVLNNKLIISKFKLGLTGTYPNVGTPEYEKLSIYLPMVDSIDEKTALANNWITPHQEYNLRVEYTDEEKDRYEQYTKFITETWRIFKDSHKLLIAGLEQQGYSNMFLSRLFPNEYTVIRACYTGAFDKVLGTIDSHTVRTVLAYMKRWDVNLDMSMPENVLIDQIYNPTNIFNRVKLYAEIERKRNVLINTAQNKVKAIVDIVNHFKDMKIISFSQSIKFADDVYAAVSEIHNKAVIFHSKLKKVHGYDDDGNLILIKSGVNKGKPKEFGATVIKRDAIQGMKNGRYTFISTVDSLNEGLSIEDLAVAIIASGDCNSIKDKQRKARVKTIDTSNSNKLSYIINLYLDDFVNSEGNVIYSRDLKKLKLRQDLNSNAIYINSVSQINLK